MLLIVAAAMTTNCNGNKAKGCRLTEEELIEIKYHYLKWHYFNNEAHNIDYDGIIAYDTLILEKDGIYGIETQGIDTIISAYYPQLADSMEYHLDQIACIRNKAGKRYSQDCFFEYTPKWDMECDSLVHHNSLTINQTIPKWDMECDSPVVLAW